MSREDERTLSTADLAGVREAAPTRDEPDRLHGDAAEQQDGAMRDGRMTQVETARGDMARDGAATRPAGSATHAEPLAELFPADAAAAFRSRWDAVQIGFVDDPKQAVKQADELVAQVMKSLAESFSRQRSTIEGGTAGNDASTENLRVALQRYRSFFQRLLSL
ncbi:MAG: hypothetical protein JWP43_879 [Ramlibacter sp.]|jgi:hypothetical protein|nr:hypothetical protein [Ramlibacter sp.]